MSLKLFNTAAGFPRTAYGIQVSMLRPYLHDSDYQSFFRKHPHKTRTKAPFTPVKVWDCSSCRRPVFYRRLAYQVGGAATSGLFRCDTCWR